MPISHRKIPEKNQEISDCSGGPPGWLVVQAQCAILPITSAVRVCSAGEGGESPDEEIYRVVPKY